MVLARPPFIVRVGVSPEFDAVCASPGYLAQCLSQLEAILHGVDSQPDPQSPKAPGKSRQGQSIHGTSTGDSWGFA
jgi:hypothetical protein